MTTATLIAPGLAAGSTAPRSRRLVSVDVFRGLLVAGMILVTNAGSWDYVYWPLKHADWNGSTPTDMIFPSFLFLAGVSMTFSFASRAARGATRMQLAAHVAWRGLLLILIGLFLNGFPLFDWHNLRIPGVLQRIGLCYCIGGLLYLGSNLRSNPLTALKVNLGVMVLAMLILTAGYWVLMLYVPVPGHGVGRLDQAGSLEGYIDRALMGTNHLWFWGGQMWDPEGLLSTMTATVNLLLGILTGDWLRSERSESRKILGLVSMGTVLLITGLALNPVIPINKKIWTPSFVLLSGGFSLLALAALIWLIDLRGWRRGLTPAVIFGTNAILGFALANMINPVFGLLRWHDAAGRTMTIPSAVFGFFAKFLSPWNASLAYALAFVLLNMAILYSLYRRRIFVRL